MKHALNSPRGSKGHPSCYPQCKAIFNRKLHEYLMLTILSVMVSVATHSQPTMAFSRPLYTARTTKCVTIASASMLHQSSRANELTINEDEEEFENIDSNTLTREDLNSMTITQLMDLLKSKGKKVAGNKSELIDRLLQTDNGREDSALLNNGNGPSPIHYAFSASPIKITLQQPISKETKPIEDVNFATLRFNAKLNDMSKNMDASTAPKVESLLLDALNKYEQHLQNQTSNQSSYPRELITPNTVSFTNAITAWARCSRKDSPHRAQALLDKMHYLYKVRKWHHAKPNKISYNSVINAWAKSTERGSGRRAEKLLSELWKFWEEEGREGELKPDARSFNVSLSRDF